MSLKWPSANSYPLWVVLLRLCVKQKALQLPFFFSFSFVSVYLNGKTKAFSDVPYVSRVTSNGLMLLDELECACVEHCSLNCYPRCVWPCQVSSALEKILMTNFLNEHMRSCYSTTKTQRQSLFFHLTTLILQVSKNIWAAWLSSDIGFLVFYLFLFWKFQIYFATRSGFSKSYHFFAYCNLNLIHGNQHLLHLEKGQETTRNSDTRQKVTENPRPERERNRVDN